MTKASAPYYRDMPIPIVGGTKFGRFDKISAEQTFNFIISDGWLVPFSGYKRQIKIDPSGKGRGIYSSSRLNIMIVIIDNDVYVVDNTLSILNVGNINTFSGDVFIAENNVGQFAISDLSQYYIYDHNLGTVTSYVIAAGFKPGQISFQDGRFIVPDLNSNVWRLSDVDNGTVFQTINIARILTKPDKSQATVPVPGRGNSLFVFGKTVTELWQDVGQQTFPYQRSTSVNLDYGCANAATIAESDNLVCWLAQNEKSGYVIMYSNGGYPERISNDGIDFKLASLQNPEDSYGYIFKQDGHLIYVLVFPFDNFSIAYDFNTQSFFTVTDEGFDNFIAKRVVFFNNTYYFVSFYDGNVYELNSKFTNYDYGDGNIEIIPRVRVTPSFRLPDQSRFVAGYAGLTIESGYTSDTQRVELSLSKDGGVTFGNTISKNLPTIGKRQNRMLFWRLGIANDLVLQFRFYGLQRFVVNNGIIGLTQ